MLQVSPQQTSQTEQSLGKTAIRFFLDTTIISRCISIQLTSQDDIKLEEI